MITLATALTPVVVIVKIAVVEPAATVTAAGTAATVPSADARLTTMPPEGAGPVSVRVPLPLTPPTTAIGPRANPLSAAGFIVSAADWLVPAYVAEMSAVVTTLTAVVAIENVAVVTPAATITLTGGRPAGLSLNSITTAPVDGAADASDTVANTCVPPVIAVDRSVNPVTPAAGGGDMGSGIGCGFPWTTPFVRWVRTFISMPGSDPSVAPFR